MLRIKSDRDSGKECSKTSIQNVDEKISRESQECDKSQSSSNINKKCDKSQRSRDTIDDVNDNVQLKRQNVPHRQERFEEMIRRKKYERKHFSKPITTEKFAANSSSEKENLNEMEFDVTQWENTLWMKEKERFKISPYDEGEKKTTDKGLTISNKLPFENELPGEVLTQKLNKGNYLIRTAIISIGIDSLELIAALTTIIILLFTINFNGWNTFYPIFNTIFTTFIILCLIITHSFHLYVNENRNNQNVIEYYIPIFKKYLFLYGHTIRCVFVITSIIQTTLIILI
ncbi:putative integral membrane protein [Brugia pahangi]